MEPIYLDETDRNNIIIEKKEVLRYLGYFRANPDETMQEQINACVKELHSLLRCRAVFTRRNVRIEEDRLDFGFAVTESANLAKNLNGCSEAYLFVATIGADIDRRIKRYQAVSPAKGVIAQAVGAAAIEAYCDYLNDRWRKEEAEQSRVLKPRFSPGYGDLSIVFQKPLLQELDAARKLGLGLTNAYLMVPEKSVSAIIGIKEER